MMPNSQGDIFLLSTRTAKETASTKLLIWTNDDQGVIRSL